MFLLIPALAAAECLPGQMQEANLAYQSAAQFLQQQQWDQAIARLQSIVSVCPEHVEANRGLGTAFYAKQDYVQATEYYTTVIDLRADKVEAGDYANLAKALAKQKMYKEARAEYMKAEMLAPDDCGVLFNLGVMHYAAGFYTQSVDVLEHVVNVDACGHAKDPALKQLANSATKAAEQQRRAGNNTKAAYYSDLAAQYGGQAGGSTTYDMVKQKMKAQDYIGAVDLLDQMLAQNPDQPNAWLTKARAQDAAGQKTGSVASYREYLALKPDNTEEWGTMIQVMVEAGQCTEAKAVAADASANHAAKGRRALAPINYSWGLALECTQEYETARAKFAACAASGHQKYASSARQQVERMDGFMQMQAAERKKAAQGG
jgi:tetratricopeptide (TPR) repeat protein